MENRFEGFQRDCGVAIPVVKVRDDGLDNRSGNGEGQQEVELGIKSM